MTMLPIRWLRDCCIRIKRGPRRLVRLTDMPNELIMQVASCLALPDLNSLLQTSHFLAVLLNPMILDLAATSLAPRNTNSSVLHWAASHNRGQLMKSLLDHGAESCINHLNRAGMTPLYSAIVLGYEEPVQILLDNGANTEIVNLAGWTALMTAVISGNRSLSMLLLGNGADINSHGVNVGRVCALHYAAGLGHMDILHLLVQKGCDTLSVNSYKLNAVQTAAACDQKEMVEYLLRHGGFGRNDDTTSWARKGSHYSITRTNFSLSCILSNGVDFCDWFAGLRIKRGAVA